MTHWQASCTINRLLLGQKGMPLCARAYRRNWRLFMFCADLVFGEADHCKKIHRRWSEGRTEGRKPCVHSS